jgi:hypothetical protein
MRKAGGPAWELAKPDVQEATEFVAILRTIITNARR